LNRPYLMNSLNWKAPLIFQRCSTWLRVVGAGPHGGYIKIGKITRLHGDQIGSGPNIAKKLVESVHGTAVMGHVHRPSMFTVNDKWSGYTLPCLCTLAPPYAKGRPNVYCTGFGIIERGAISTNLHNIIISNGTFSWAAQSTARPLLATRTTNYLMPTQDSRLHLMALSDDRLFKIASAWAACQANEQRHDRSELFNPLRDQDQPPTAANLDTLSDAAVDDLYHSSLKHYAEQFRRVPGVLA
jgi:hypothetical protein